MVIGVAVAVIALGGVALVATAEGANVTKYKSSGAFAQCSEYEPGDYSIYISVWESGTGADRMVYLDYSVYDYTTSTHSYGYGNIPAGDFKASGNKTTLQTDTADMTAIYKYGDDVEIDLAWKKDGSFWSKSTGHSVYHYPGYKRTQNGSSTQYSAACSGTVGDYTVPDADADFHSGSVGSNKNMTITIEKN